MMIHLDLSEDHLNQIIKSVSTNPSIEAHIREEILKPIRESYKSQLKENQEGES